MLARLTTIEAHPVSSSRGVPYRLLASLDSSIAGESVPVYPLDCCSFLVTEDDLAQELTRTNEEAEMRSFEEGETTLESAIP